MFKEIVLFEIKYRLKRLSTYVYFLLWFGFTLYRFSTALPAGKVYANAPPRIFDLYALIMMAGILVVSAIFGTAILRDFRENTYELFFTKPIRKSCYLGGRLVGSAIISVLIFSGVLLGAVLGSIMPWAQASAFMPLRFWFYFQPFLLLVVPGILFTGALFFAVGALTRSVVAVYLQGIIFLVLYLCALEFASAAPDTMGAFWAALLDPMGVRTGGVVTRYWTISEQNTLTIPFAGVMTYNRLFWLGLGALAVVVTFRCFPFSAEALVRRRFVRNLAESEREPEPASAVFSIRPPVLEFGLRTRLAQFLSSTKLRLSNILGSLPFIALVLLAMGLLILDGRTAGRFLETPAFPVTYLMASTFRSEILLFVVIAAIYAGELAWKERDLKFDQIQDALPMPDWLTFASRVAALSLVFVMLTGLAIVVCMAVQASLGYYRFELPLYFKEIALIDLTLLIQYSVAALLVQTLVRNKFLGHTLIVGLYLLLLVLGNYGYSDRLYRFGETPPYTYSDMNGYGHFVQPILWFKLYWTAFSLVLAVVAILLMTRGTELSWRARLRQARERLRPGLLITGFGGAAAFMTLGGFIFYNTHVLNRLEDEHKDLDLKADYERKYKQYEGLPQPKILAVEVRVDIFPERRAFQARGTFVLSNKTGQPIGDIHITDLHRVLQKLDFDRPFEERLRDPLAGYYIYRLAAPLPPGENLTLRFSSTFAARGFMNNGERDEFACNGTYFDREYFPLVGYSQDGEVTDEIERKKRNLPSCAEMPPPEDVKAHDIQLLASDADWVTFKATISTSPDQIALAPGYLEREWTENGRRYFLYDMGAARIRSSYGFLSGRYAVKRDRWQDINIEVFYHPQHEYNVTRMIEGAKAGLEYYTRNFGPYQFRQFRIIECPRYGVGVRSFPNTIAYSEDSGFLAHASREEDLDVPFYVTAHELAHQWWGHQVIGCYAQGSQMLLESLAQYSALMVTEKELGPANTRAYLKRELDRYLEGRGDERKGEPPLYLVSNQAYVYYHKGSLAMYGLKDHLGEERLNGALRNFLKATRFQEPPYTDSREFLRYIREATPPERQSVVTDLFETITLFDNRALGATYRETADHRYLVKLRVSARKLRADGLGAENEIPLDDLIDIGVFAGERNGQTPLFLEKRRITQPQTEFEITVEELPTSAGIDPYNKLIDRQPDDNTVAVTKALKSD